MGDMLFDDFDVDALLDAQSSDDDGSDLPELERSLDDILNDTECADILGSVYAITAPRIDPLKNSEFSSNGRAPVGLEGENIENLRSGLEYENGEKDANGLVDEIAHDDPREEFTEIAHSIEEDSQGTTPSIEDLHGLSSSGTAMHENAWQSDKSQIPTEGAETTGARSISSSKLGGWDSNGRTSGAAAVVDLLPQSTKTKSSPRPGAAAAAAAAASRQSGALQSSVASRFSKRAHHSQKSSLTGTLENGGGRLEIDRNVISENSLPRAQILDKITDLYEFPRRALESDVAQQDSQDLGGRFANVGLLGFSVGHDGSTGQKGVEWNSDEIHAATIGDFSEEVEILSSLDFHLHEQPSYLSSFDASELLSEGRNSESAPGGTDSVIAPEGCARERAEDADNGSSASESGVDVVTKSKAIMDHLAEPVAQSDLAEPELSDVVSLNNWIEESQEHLITNAEAIFNFQLERAQNLALRRDSIHANADLQAIDDVAQKQETVGAEEKIDKPIRLEEKPLFTALHIAEELEKNAASSGLHWEVGAVAQPMRLEGIQRGAPAIGLLQLDSGGSLSYALQNSALRREHGLPQALAVHSNFIAIGLSKGGILVIPSKYSATRSADETDAKHSVLATPGPDKSVSALCFNQQGDLLLVGYSNGHLMLWDVPKANVIKTLEKEHSAAVVHALFLGQEVPGARNFKAITSDSKGLTLLHTFTVLPVPVLRRYTVNTTCILDGQRTGIVLSVSPLLPEEGSQIGGGLSTALHGGSSVPMNLSSVMGVVGAASSGDVGRKFLYDGAVSPEESGGGLVVFVTQQVALVVRLLPSVEVCARLSRPDGIREGAIPYTAWRRTKLKAGISGNLAPTGPSITSTIESVHAIIQKDGDGRPLENVQIREDATVEGLTAKVNNSGGENCPSLAIAWDRKVLIYQLPKSELKSVVQWEMDSPAVGVAWLEEQMMVVATSNDQLCLFTNEGIEIERAALGSEHGGIGAFTYHTHFMNLYGNPEKAYHNALAVRGAALYLLGPNRLWRARLLPWRDRIKALENAGDWMGAFHIAMEIYDGRSQGVTGLPRGLEAMREAIMPTLLALLSAYIDEAFAYLSLALGPSTLPTMMKIGPEPINKMDTMSQKQELPIFSRENGVETSVQEMVVEAREQYARVGGVAIEFCVHIRKTEVLFENVFNKFEAVGQRGTFLELLEPYILKDMLGGLAPEVMQALVEHYSSRGWLNRVEQCVLHMDIASLDFNQVVRVCRDHGLYSALIYLFTKGLDDFKSPLEELLAVAQNWRDLSQGKAFGYKLLVYLKYCFTGLAFPPGNGTLSLLRLPKLRAELLGYLLDPVDPVETSRDGVLDHEISGHKLYSRLLYLLQLDTQGSLLVLGAAFPEDGPLGVGKRDWVYPLISVKLEQGDISHNAHSQSAPYAVPTGESMVEGLKLAQDTIDAVVHVLQTTCGVGRTSNSEEAPVCPVEKWPTETDTGYMLEFVAHFAAGKYALMPAAIMSRVLEHLTSPSVGGSADLELVEKNQGILKLREDLMVALLKAVPKSEWDVQQTLQLAQHVGYWQVTALLYAQMNDYTAALDSYLKDVSRPQHSFMFISHMLSSENGLERSSLTSFHEAVLSRLPELIELSTQSTLFIVLKHFSSENQRILRELTPHPKLLFNYLKAVMNIRSSGLDCSQSGLEKDVGPAQQPTPGELLVRDQQVALPGQGGQELEDHSVLDSQVHLADLLQRSGLEFTNEMAETFVELLCRFEPKSVLRFLERYENYRLDHCLKLCQEYGITDAAAFLLERVGDVASALSLVLADVHISMLEMDQVLAQLVKENVQNSSGDECLDLTKVVASAQSVLQAAIALCQRNTFRFAIPQESETLWFRLLDRFVEFLHKLNKQTKSSGSRKQRTMKREATLGTEQGQRQTKNTVCWKVRGSDLASKLLRKVLVRFIADIVNGMMGYVPLPVIMRKILEDHRGHEFGDFKAIILDMLSAYGYERAILGTAKQLIEDDAFQNISALKRGCTHAFCPIDSTCTVCERRLDEPGLGGAKSRQTSSASSTDNLKGKVDDEMPSSSNINQPGIRIYPCGHATHLDCMEVDSRSEFRRSLTTVVCPICSYSRKPIDLFSHSRDSSLVNGGFIGVGAGKARQHNLADYKRQGSSYRTTNQAFRQSRLQLLKHLEDGTDLHELGQPLKLNLAPASALYKRETLPNGGSSRAKSNGKSLLASSTRADNRLTFQRKSKQRPR